MIVTTTNSVEGHQIVEYLGIVTGEAVSGINMFRDLGAGIRNVFGGRSAGYEEELQQARNEVLDEMQQRAANALPGEDSYAADSDNGACAAPGESGGGGPDPDPADP